MIFKILNYKKKIVSFLVCFSLFSTLSSCTNKTISDSSENQSFSSDKNISTSINSNGVNQNISSLLTIGTSIYRGFTLDNIYHSKNNGDIHFHIYFPDGFNTNEKYALFISLPGCEGLYFQGVGRNIKSENFVFEAQKYNSKMIILAPQLNDWGNTSALQTVELCEFFLENYPIDKSKVFINGYSGGGETLSFVLTLKPELFTAALHVASVWDGQLQPIVESQTPIYFVIGESDEYYGSSRIASTYNSLINLYCSKGLSDETINELAVLDIKKTSYFYGSNQHGGIGKVSQDEKIMGWLFRR